METVKKKGVKNVFRDPGPATGVMVLPLISVEIRKRDRLGEDK